MLRIRSVVRYKQFTLQLSQNDLPAIWASSLPSHLLAKYVICLPAVLTDCHKTSCLLLAATQLHAINPAPGKGPKLDSVIHVPQSDCPCSADKQHIVIC